MLILQWGITHKFQTEEIYMLDQLLGDHKDQLIEVLTSKLGVNGDQAGGFLSKIFPMIQGLLGDGKLDVADLMKGDLSSIKGGLDLDMLGGLLGGGKDKAEQGIDAISGPISDNLGKLDDPVGLLGNLIGGGDANDLMAKAKKGLGGLLG